MRLEGTDETVHGVGASIKALRFVKRLKLGRTPLPESLVDDEGFERKNGRRKTLVQKLEEGGGDDEGPEGEETASEPEPEPEETSEVRLKRIFDEADDDDSGTLDRQEARGVLRQMGINLYADVKQAIKELSSDGTPPTSCALILLPPAHGAWLGTVC